MDELKNLSRPHRKISYFEAREKRNKKERLEQNEIKVLFEGQEEKMAPSVSCFYTGDSTGFSDRQ